MSSALYSPGDVLKFPRPFYSHYAVYVGNGYIIHVTENSADSAKSDAVFCASTTTEVAVVKKEKLSDLKIPDGIIEVETQWGDKQVLPRQMIVKRAQSRLGEKKYALFSYNCESFAHWCRYGEEGSDQADGLKAGLVIAGAVVAGGLGVALASWLKDDKKGKQNQ